MGLRHIETDVVEVEVLSLREHLVIVYAYPFPEGLFLLWSEKISVTPYMRVLLRPGELGSDHAADSDLGSVVVTLVAELDVVGIVCHVRAHCAIYLSLHTDLSA